MFPPDEFVMEKRENFAVNLRKQKRTLIINSKRLKYDIYPSHFFEIAESLLTPTNRIDSICKKIQISI